MDNEQLGFDESVEIANEAFATDVELENSKKKYKSVYKKGGHNRCRENGK